MLLKGTQLTNTEWVIGFVVYTGKETRIMMNSAEGNVKVSDVERTMNLFTIYIVSTLTILTLVLAILGGFWHDEASEINEELNELNSVHYYIDFG